MRLMKQISIFSATLNLGQQKATIRTH